MRKFPVGALCRPMLISFVVDLQPFLSTNCNKKHVVSSCSTRTQNKGVHIGQDGEGQRIFSAQRARQTAGDLFLANKLCSVSASGSMRPVNKKQERKPMVFLHILISTHVHVWPEWHEPSGPQNHIFSLELDEKFRQTFTHP